jgi:hypothetical protein
MLGQFIEVSEAAVMAHSRPGASTGIVRAPCCRTRPQRGRFDPDGAMYQTGPKRRVCRRVRRDLRATPLSMLASPGSPTASRTDTMSKPTTALVGQSLATAWTSRTAPLRARHVHRDQRDHGDDHLQGRASGPAAPGSTSPVLPRTALSAAVRTGQRPNAACAGVCGGDGGQPRAGHLPFHRTSGVVIGVGGELRPAAEGRRGHNGDHHHQIGDWRRCHDVQADHRNGGERPGHREPRARQSFAVSAAAVLTITTACTGICQYCVGDEVAGDDG